MHPLKIAEAVRSGVSTVCATCDRYWEGRERNLAGGRCTSPEPCGSPLVGDFFHNYQGPITDFHAWCFVCGEQPTHAIGVQNSRRRFGICEQHYQMLPHLRPVHLDHPEQPVRPVQTVLDGSAKDFHLPVIVSKRRTIWDAIRDTEEEWEHEARKRGDPEWEG